MEYILLLEKAERLKAALDNTKIAYYELRKENEQLKKNMKILDDEWEIAEEILDWVRENHTENAHINKLLEKIDN